MSDILDPVFYSLVDSQGDILRINTDGSISNAPVDGTKATYSAPAGTISPPASATDIYTLYGSATKTIRVIKFELSGTQTVAGQVIIELVRRNSQNSGGTFATGVIIPHDTNNPTATAVAQNYSVNPVSLGNSIGIIRIGRVFIPAAATPNPGSLVSWTFGDRPGQAIVLRGINQGLTVNLNATTITGGAFFVNMEWTEE